MRAAEGHIWVEKAGLEFKMNTKMELNHNKVGRIRDLADLGLVLFPHNKRHQRVFLAVFIELKYAPEQSLPSLDWIAVEYGISRRVFEIVRAKMRRLGLIDHVSRFSKRSGYREAWMFSTRFRRSLIRLSELQRSFVELGDAGQEQRDRDLFRYL
jgi:hypothetical protein